MTLYSWSFGYMGRWPAGGLDLGLVVFLVWGCSFCMSFGLVRGCDPAFCVVWFRFRLLRRYLALWPTEVRRVYHLLEMVSEGSPGQGPAHLLSASAAEIGFRWDPVALAWSRPGLPLLSNLAGPIQHFKAAILDAWRNEVAADLCGRKGFRSGPSERCGWGCLEWFATWTGLKPGYSMSVLWGARW